MRYKPYAVESHHGRAAIALIGACFLASCSTMSGTKFDRLARPPTADKPLPVAGIPYTLSKPEFSLTIGKPPDGATKPTFAISVNYVPDPSQTYTITPAPGVFSDPNFTVSLDANGAMTAVTSKTTDQLAPAIVAVGKFAVSALAITGAAFDKATTDSNSLFIVFIDANNPSCQAPSDLPSLWQMSIDEVTIDSGGPKVEPAKTNGQLALRVKSFADLAALKARFHAITPGEYQCLSDLVGDYRGNAKRREQEWDQFYTTLAPAEYKTTFEYEFSSSERKLIDDAIAAGNSDDLAAIWKRKATELKGDATFKKVRDKAADVLSHNPDKPALDIIVSALDLKFDAWRARQVGFLAGRSEHFHQKMIRAKDAKQRTADANNVALVDGGLIATIDDAGLEKRRVELKAFMSRALEVNINNAHVSAAQEFVAARTEWDSLTKQLADLKAKYLLALTSASTPPAIEPGTSSAAICTKDTAGTVHPPVQGAPPSYCLVLEDRL